MNLAKLNRDLEGGTLRCSTKICPENAMPKSIYSWYMSNVIKNKSLVQVFSCEFFRHFLEDHFQKTLVSD